MKYFTVICWQFVPTSSCQCDPIIMHNIAAALSIMMNILRCIERATMVRNEMYEYDFFMWRWKILRGYI